MPAPPSQPSRTIVVTVAAADAEAVADRMWGWGVHAVSEVDLPDGRAELTTSVGSDPAAIQRALAQLDGRWAVDVVDVDASLAQVPAEFLAPTWYAPTMVSVPAALLPFTDPAAEVVTVIDPGSAFGLGDHPTTRTMMSLLAELLRSPAAVSPAPCVLDVGCGTGVLAIVAAQLGASAVRAIDVSDAAVEATMRNGELNGVADRIVVDTTPIGSLADAYDVVVANISAGALVSIATDLHRLLRCGGSLVVGGIVARRRREVLDALAPLEAVASRNADGWTSILLR